MDNHIVYAGYYEGTCVYVGEGKPDRYKHLTSGVSHVYEANYYHHTGRVVEVKVLKFGLSKEDSVRFEKELILTLKPLWNRAAQFSVGGGSIKKKAEDKLLSVFGRKVHLKSKQRQIEVLRQIIQLLDSTGVTRVSAQQTTALLGCPKVMHSIVDPTEWEESNRIFSVVKLKTGLWEVKLNES